MNATTAPNHRPMMLLLLVATIMAVMSVMALNYGAIPRSRHAQTKHQTMGEVWNTDTITEYFDAGKCTPQEYMCPGAGYTNKIAFCEIKPGLSIGLIIGWTKIVEAVRHDIIVTGFASSSDYWKPGGDVCK